MQRTAALLHSAGPSNKTPTTALVYTWDIPYPHSNAWQDAKASGAVNYMATGERSHADYIYGDLDLAEIFAMDWLKQNNLAATIARSAPTVSELTTQHRDQLLKATDDTC